MPSKTRKAAAAQALPTIPNELIDQFVPDGQVKLLHLWPPKLLHLSWARRTNYGVDSVAVAMRSAASFSR